MGLCTKEINKIKDAQKILDECQKKIKSGIKNLEKWLIPYVQKEWDKTFPGMNVRFLTGFSTGCFTKNFVKEVWFYEVNDLEYYKGNFYNIIFEDGKLCSDYRIEKTDTISVKDIRKFLKKMSNELDVCCKLVDSSLVENYIFDKHPTDE